MRNPRLRYVLAMLLVPLWASCASAPPEPAATGAGGAPASLNVIIDNRVVGAGTYDIFVTPEAGGSRQLIGRIQPNEERTFRFQAVPGAFRLSISGSGVSRTSSRFTLGVGQTATWRLDRATVVVRVPAPD